jgi:hypothetical protein
MIVVLVILASVLLIAYLPVSGQLSSVNDKTISCKRMLELNHYLFRLMGNNFSKFHFLKDHNTIVRHNSTEAQK